MLPKAFEVRGAGCPSANGIYHNTSVVWHDRPLYKNASGLYLSFCPPDCIALQGWGIRKGIDSGTLYYHSGEGEYPPVEGYRRGTVEQGGIPPMPTVHPVLRGVKRCADRMLERAWKDRKFTDAEIVCAGTRTAVHRVTLASASPVFDAAFSSAMSEGRNAVFEIKEASPAAVEAMLSYIYTGTLEHSCAELEGLLDLAVQYELEELGIEVSQRLKENVNVDNVRARCLALKRYSEKLFVAEALKDVIKFVKDDADDKLILALIS
eukprot:TRINITY_DN113320_c0_g1_i1.p1 TRINITY_DN113320_c0_g1~~TRINITY_DN113320_c0_g1_i1.p1  ORF type:complete len:265 (-),score=37.12 TRINITY_DN113320_c0_g1_i1:40-834(-)